MKEELVKRIFTVANHIVDTHDTIRKTATIYGYSKSTIHHDVSIKLKNLDYKLYQLAQKILDQNFSEKHIRGGEATKQKYLHEEEEREI